MCLKTKKSKAFIADEDIECYKLVELKGNGLYAPIQDDFFYGSIDDIIGKKIIPNKFIDSYENDLFSTDILGTYRIKYGIHTFSSLEVMRSRLYWYDKYGINVIGYKCIIPKGSKYYEGTNFDLCSDKIIVKEEIE